MKSLKIVTFHILFVVLYCPLLLSGKNSFSEVSDFLDTDGTFVGYASFEGDGEKLAGKLQELYVAFSEHFPALREQGANFSDLFASLGLDRFQSVAASSVELENQIVRNKTVLSFTDEPGGIFEILGKQPIRFRAAELAPEDATLAYSIRLDAQATKALLDSLVASTGLRELKESWQSLLSRPLPYSDIQTMDVLYAFSGQIDIVQKLEKPDGLDPEVKLWISIENAGTLGARYLEDVSKAGVVKEVETEGGRRIWDLSALSNGDTEAFYASTEEATGNLILFTHDGWVVPGVTDGGLVGTETFQNFYADLPRKALLFSYNSSSTIDLMLGEVIHSLKQEEFNEVAESIIDFGVGDFTKPVAWVVYRSENRIHSIEHAGYSYKQLSVIPALAISGAVIVPTVGQFRAVARRSAITSNLRQINMAAALIVVESEAESISFAQIRESELGEGINSVAGESYDHIVITPETKHISVTLPNGEVVSVDLFPIW
ncbi:hypothetical protein QEH56_02145 [Pelagicoccus enzymogenes]|uniref:hypothetical protein n=1 Tax=Pelagicoccus enzymogenes TaxID=2773457 RepID=UPI00280DF52E|nr:hypothetical protein [Pelagicoccus enzymogenes]MDQ8196927.1 hypothetical protein [Pelagicoccus enzymogenes]